MFFLCCIYVDLALTKKWYFFIRIALAYSIVKLYPHTKCVHVRERERERERERKRERGGGGGGRERD